MNVNATADISVAFLVWLWRVARSAVVNRGSPDARVVVLTVTMIGMDRLICGALGVLFRVRTLWIGIVHGGGGRYRARPMDQLKVREREQM